MSGGGLLTANGGRKTDEPNVAINPSPVLFTTVPPCSSTARPSLARCSLRSLSKAASPSAAMSSVDATRSVNSTAATPDRLAGGTIAISAHLRPSPDRDGPPTSVCVRL
jgi:hypothetical protein